MYEYKAHLVRIYDADTMWFDIDLGFYCWLHDQAIRLYGINAYEIRGVQRGLGLGAKAAAQHLFDVAGPEVTLHTFKDAKEKYGRWLGTVVLADGTNLNEWLVLNGHAVVNYYE